MAHGHKTGGRKKGTPNRLTRERQKAIAASGLTPLEYMLAVLRDETADPHRRDEMAKAAAPYCHPQLAAVNHSGEIAARFVAEMPPVARSIDEWREIYVPQPYRAN